MRILYLVNVPRAFVTGAAKHVLTLARMATETGARVAIAGPPGSALERTATDRGLAFCPVLYRPTPWDLARLWSVIRAEDPDVIDAMSVIPLVLAVPSVLSRRRMRRHGRAVFVSILVDPESPLPYSDGRRRPAATAFRNRLLRRVAPSLDGIFPISHAVRDTLERMRVEGRKVVVGGLLDFQALEQGRRAPIDLPPGRPRIGTAVGQLERLKGVEYLLRAFARLAERYPAAACLVTGEGSQRADLESFAARLGVGDRFHLIGYLEDPTPLMGALDLYVSPSLTEGLGGAIGEAMALGVPVVATGVGGVRDLISDGRSGLLVPPADSDALADAIERLLGDPALVSRLTAEARSDVLRRHGADHGFRAVWEEYRRAAGRGCHSARPIDPENGAPR